MLPQKNLDQLSELRSNNFNLLRMGAALCVVLSHSFILTGNEPNALPRILGYVSVNCFFLISGFLVCKSLLDRRSIAKFLRARALRIYPALIFAVLLCVFIIGPLFTTLSTKEYFLNTKTYEFLLKNSMLLVGDVVINLPGVFSQGKYGSWVNAPLWTIFYEVYMYLGLALIAFFITLSKVDFEKRLRIVISIIAALTMTAFLIDTGYKLFSDSLIGVLLRFTALFSMGATLYLYRAQIRLSTWLFLAMVIIVGLSAANRVLFNVAFYLFLGYFLLYLAYLPSGWLLKFNQLGDYSYGIYVFAYPIQQAVTHWYPNLHSIELFVYAMVPTMALAVFSWHFIESKALALK